MRARFILNREYVAGVKIINILSWIPSVAADKILTSNRSYSFKDYLGYIKVGDIYLYVKEQYN